MTREILLDTREGSAIVYLVVDWIDGIPETVRVYADKNAAQQYRDTVGGRHQVIAKDIL